MDCKALFEEIEKLTPAYEKVWEDVCNIESPTDDKAGVDAVGAYLTEIASRQGWVVESAHMEVSGDPLCFTLNPDAPGKAVVFSGHMDTVHPKGFFGYPPVRIEDGCIHGPGVNDCKGGVVASLLAAHALQNIGFDKRPVKIILQSDEENGSRTSNKATVQWMGEKAMGCEAFLNAEGYTPGYLTVQRKGILRYEINVTGRADHSSRCDRGINAIEVMAPIVLALSHCKDPAAITCNCGVISGGTVANSVPARCTMVVDFRFATAEQKQQIRQIMKDVTAVPSIEGAVVEYSQISYRTAMERARRNLDLAQRISEIFVASGLPAVEPRVMPAGSDASDISAMGIPTVDSVGVRGPGGHSIREHSELKALPDSAKRLASVAYML